LEISNFKKKSIGNFEPGRSQDKNDNVENGKPDLECVLKLRVTNFWTDSRVAMKQKGIN
jgi:hypothetical protein